MATDTTKAILSSLTLQQERLFLPNGSQVQVYPSLAHMAFSPSSAIKKYQYAALIRKERILLIWHDKLDTILVHAAAVESKLLALVCSPRVLSGLALTDPDMQYACLFSSPSCPREKTRNQDVSNTVVSDLSGRIDHPPSTGMANGRYESTI